MRHLTDLNLTIVLIIMPILLMGQNSQTHQDCKTAYPICAMKTYHFDSMEGYGDIQESNKGGNCFEGLFKETNSKWLKFKSNSNDILTFVISPNQDGDDLDFILYKKGNQACDELIEIRCMASGEDLGRPDENSSQCLGVTGLVVSAVDEFETRGCAYSDDNFLKMLNTEKDEEYYLLVNNYNNSEGFSITFEGKTKLVPYEDCGKESKDELLSIVHLYPNPTIQSIEVEYLSAKEAIITVDVIDMMGKSVKRTQWESARGVMKNVLQVEELPAATYLIRLRSGEYTTTHQFVKL